MKITLDIPDSWIEALKTLPLDPADGDESIERRLYDAILAQVDHATELIDGERKAAGVTN